jgi:hypothetical protein
MSASKISEATPVTLCADLAARTVSSDHLLTHFAHWRQADDMRCKTDQVRAAWAALEVLAKRFDLR